MSKTILFILFIFLSLIFAVFSYINSDLKFQYPRFNNIDVYIAKKVLKPNPFIHINQISCSPFKINTKRFCLLENPFRLSQNVLIRNRSTNDEDDIFIQINGNNTYLQKFYGGLGIKIKNIEIKNINLYVRKGYEDKFDKIILYNGLNLFFFNDFSQIEKSDDVDNLYFNKYKIPNTVKSDKYSKYLNYNGFITDYSNFVITFFSGAKIYIPSYILFFISLLYFLYNRNEISKTIPKNFWLSFLIIVLIHSIIIYSNKMFNYFIYNDEYYSVILSTNLMSWKVPFMEAGNPPFFHLLLRVFNIFFGYSLFKTRILILCISIFFLIFLFIFLKSRFNSKIALFGLFLASINIPVIMFAQQIRSYIFQILLTPIFICTLFNIIEKNKNKYYALYCILSIIATNTHYYEIIFLTANFIYFTFFCVFKKRYKDILKFLLVNIVGSISLIPFLAISGWDNGVCNLSYNSWNPKLNFTIIKSCLNYIFGSLSSCLFFIFSFAFIFTKKDVTPRDKNLIFYLCFTIISVLLMSIIFSFFRPITYDRYFIYLIPCFIIYISSVLYYFKQNKIAICIIILWIFCIQSNYKYYSTAEHYNKHLVEYDYLPLSFANNYSNSTKKQNKPVYYITNMVMPVYENDFPELSNTLIQTPGQISFLKYQIANGFDKIYIDNIVDKIFERDENPIIFSLYHLSPKYNKMVNKYEFINSTTNKSLNVITK